ncbi:hypothetical protein EMCRGX_G011173 [Ephydatia muelleri]|eukprot:Em0006g1119a
MSRYACSIIAFLLVSYVQSQILNISVEDAGVDGPTCIHGDAPCHTLDYVLLSLSNTTCSTLVAATVYIDVSFSLNLLPAKYDFICPLSLFISGTSEQPFGPALTCLTDDRLTFSSQTQGSVAVHWWNLRFVNCAGPDSYGLNELSFNDCLVVDSRGALIVDTATVQIQSSKYTFGRSPVGAESFLFVSHVRSAQVYITNTTVTTTSINSSQRATAVWLVNSTVHIQGLITFANNTGLLGGALRMTHSQIVADDDASVQFVNNFAQFGSAVYIEDAGCPLLNISKGHSLFILQKNAVGSAGQSQVYIDTPPQQLSTCLPDSSLYDVSFDTSQRQVSTSAVKMSVALPLGFSVIPGKYIMLTVNVTDYFQAPVACAATIVDSVRTIGEEDAAPSLCNNPRNGIELVCPFVSPQQPRPSEVLVSSDFFNSTLSVKSFAQLINSTNITIGFVCNNNATAAVSFSLSDCPSFTMYFNNATRSCECKKPRPLETHFLCSVGMEVACVEKGYWFAFENITTPLLAPCGFPYCKESFPSSCPLTDDSNFVKLDDNPDDQCLGNGGGLLCRGCTSGYYPTFPPIRCVETCSLGVSIALLLIAIAIQIAKAIFTNVLFSTSTGTGKENDKEAEAKAEQTQPDPLNFAYFYGPLFCLSFLRRLPFQYLVQFQSLNVAVSVYRTLILPALDVVSDIPWCFFPEIGTLGVFTFNYFAPLLSYVISGIVYAIRRLCARGKPGPKPSGLRSLSLLILLSFWSLSFTSIGILKGMQIEGLDAARVEIAPQLEYFTRWHIPLVIVAAIIAATLFSFILLLFLLPFLHCARIKKLHIVTKPIVEHFQFCFKKGAMWFGAVYFIVWMVMDTVSQYLAEYLLGLEIILAVFCVIHYALQPFKSPWANRIDMIILLDLLLCTSLFRHQLLLRAESLAITVIVHILVIALLIYFTCCLLALIAKQCNCISYFKKIKFSELNKGLRHPGVTNMKNMGDDVEEDFNIFGGDGNPTTKQAVHNDANDSAAQYTMVDT